jgi:hypothetical protein
MIPILTESCRREEFIWGNRIGDIIYSEEVVLLGEEETDLLLEVADNVVVFGSATEKIKKLTDVNILVSGVTEAAPYGLLRKVTGIYEEGNKVTVTTTDARLTDIIKEGIISLRIKLFEKNFTLKSKMNGVLVTGPDKAFDGLAVTLDNFELFRDGSRFATLNGAIGISPEVDLTITIRSNRITEINLLTTLNKIDELTISSNGPFSGDQERIAAEFVYTPIIIDGLVFIPEVKIICGFNGIVSGTVTCGVRQDRVITSEINYKDLNWSEDPLISSENHDFTIPLISENSDLKVFSGPEITVSLFGVPVQTVKAMGYYSLKSQKSVTPFWRLFIGNDGQNLITYDLLGLSSDHLSDLSIQESEIANSDGQ